MITLDATIVNVALRAIGADVGGAPSTAQWVVDGYTVAFASLLLLAGSLADRSGARTGFLVGLTVFVLASHPNLALLLLCTVPIGVTALAMPAMTGVAMASGPRLRHGLSAGVFNASRQAGGALGVAVLGTLLTSGPGASVSLRRPFLLTAGAYGLAVALATLTSHEGRTR